MLEPKTQTIPFKFGLNRSADVNATEPGGFLELDNCVFDQEGAVVGRPVPTAQTQISTTAVGTTFLRNGDQVALPDTVATYISSRFSEVFPGQRITSIDAQRAYQAGTAARYTAVVMTALKEDETHAWYGTFTPLTFLAVVDNDGRVLEIKELTSIIGAVFCPKIVAVSHSTSPSWLITYVTTGGDLKFCQFTWTSGAIAQAGSVTNVRTGLGTAGKRSPYDVVSNGTTVYIVLQDGSGIKYGTYVGGGSAVVPGVSSLTYSTYGSPTDMWAVLNPAGDRLVAVFLTAPIAGDLRLVAWNTSTTGTTGAQVLATGITTPGLAAIRPGAGSVLVAWNDPTKLYWATAPYNATSTSTLTSSTYADMMICSKFSLGQNNGGGVYDWLLAVYNKSGYTTGYRTIDLVSFSSGNPLVVARAAYDDAAPLVLFTGSSTYDDSVGRYGFFQPQFVEYVGAGAGTDLQFPALVAEADGAAESVPVSTAGMVRRARLVKMKYAAQPANASLGRVQLVAGSIPTSWDGIKLSPVAALSCPEAPALSVGAAGALTGVYSVRVVVEFVDARGLSWFSPPSPASSPVTLSSQKKALTASINARVMSTPVGKWKQFRLRFYSTLAGGSTYYYMSSFVMDANELWGDTDSTVSYSDNTTDANLALAEQLYSQTNDTYDLAPPLSHVTAHGNRFFGVRSDAPEVVMFTDEAQEGFLPRWNALRTIRVDNGAGPALACGSLNDSLVVFQAEQLCLVRGDGPTSSVSDTTSFPTPQRFASVGVHVDRTNTILSTASGLFFVGRRNAYLVQPDLQVVPVGSPLGGQAFWTGTTFNRARYIPSRNQVWLMVDYSTVSGTGFAASPGAFVLDLNHMKWSTMSGPATFNDTVDVAGTQYVSQSGATTVYTLTDQSGTTVNSSVTQIIELPWFRPDEGSSMRLRKVLLTGHSLYRGASTATLPNIEVKVYVQDERSAKASDTAVDTVTWTGSGVSVANDFQLSFRAPTQRCRAFRVRITITHTGSSKAIALNSLTYMYGITGPSGKQPAGNLPAIT